MAYTKYSLTPANNNAAPPDGAPEGMLPSAVNDTMRDMMAQIRDCGDGIRGGTYTMTAPVITGGSINGATIGATTASTGSFTTLAYSSTLTGGTGVVNLGSGQFYKDASGNVGIGTSTVQGKLSVQGDIYTRGGGVFYVQNSDNTNNYYLQNSGATGGANASLAFVQGGNAERMRIDSSGNVGINITNPTYKLDLVGGNGNVIRATYNSISITNFIGSASGFFGTSTNHPLGIITNGTEKLTILSGGNVGINTTNPLFKFHVVGGVIALQGGSDGSGLRYTYASNVASRSWFVSSDVLAYGDFGIGQSTTQTGSSWDYKLYFTDNGSVVIGGTANPDNFKTTVKFNSAAQNGLEVLSANEGTGYFIGCSNSSSFKFFVASTGNVTNTNNSYGAISDAKLKQNVTLASSQWDDVKALGKLVKKYSLISDAENNMQIGFIAQDALKISPGIVYSTPDVETIVVKPAIEEVKDKDGNVIVFAQAEVTETRPTGEVTLGINYSIAYMKAFKALGEALERIEALEEKLASK